MSDVEMGKIGRYVSNRRGLVFALRNLPEEVIAVLFAYYSRSDEGLRESLLRMVEDGLVPPGGPELEGAEGARERARAFHEKWVSGYGHSSVAEHATVHLGIEGVSIVGAKEIEEGRLCAYTEKSTRFVRFDRGALVREVGMPEALQPVYERGAYGLLDAYTALVPRVEAALAARHPGTAAKVISTGAFDLCRGLLPAGVGTSLGLTGNARAIAARVRSLAESTLPENRALANALRREAATLAPTLMRYTEPSAYRAGTRERVASLGSVQGAREFFALPWGPFAGWAHLREVEGDGLERVARAVLWETGRTDTSHLLTSDACREIIAAYLGAPGPHEGWGRAVEHVDFTFEVAADYGAWRDLQRHRMVSASTPTLGMDLGYAIPDGLVELGLGGDYHAALEAARAPWAEIARESPELAQYAAPLAGRVAWRLKVNARELFHIVRLRSGRAGHPSYRVLAIAMADAAERAVPWLRGQLQVDRTPSYDFAREAPPAPRPAASTGEA